MAVFDSAFSAMKADFGRIQNDRQKIETWLIRSVRKVYRITIDQIADSLRWMPAAPAANQAQP